MAKTKKAQCGATDGEHICTLKKGHEPHPFLDHIDHEAGVGFTATEVEGALPPGIEGL